MENKEKTCCFTGHRKIEPSLMNDIRWRTEKEVDRLIANGYTDFLCGGAIGYDTLAALIILLKREQNPNIRLQLCLPCRGQASKWGERDKAFYEHILKQADGVVYISEHYTPYCMHQRNRYMVDRSSCCIAYCFEPTAKGGSSYTVRYAENMGIRVINLA